jgi:hypothetical protein
LIDVADARPGSGATATKKKMVWLCAACTKMHAVQTWREPGEQIRRRSSEARMISFDEIADAQMLPGQMVA